MVDRELWAHLMRYFLRRLVVGIMIILGGVFMGLVVSAGILKPPEIDPLIILATMIVSIGMAIILLIAGLYVVVKAFSTFRLSVGSNPEETVRRFLKEFLGGYILPANPVGAFLCLSRGKQQEIGTVETLTIARQSFKTSLKEELGTAVVFFEVKSVAVSKKTSAHGSSDAHAQADVVLNVEPVQNAWDPRMSIPYRLKFELCEESNRWRICSLEGGPARFIRKPSSNPFVQSELKLGRRLILGGWICVAFATIAIVFYGFELIASGGLVGFGIVVGLLGVILLAKGYSLRARYQ